MVGDCARLSVSTHCHTVAVAGYCRVAESVLFAPDLPPTVKYVLSGKRCSTENYIKRKLTTTEVECMGNYNEYTFGLLKMLCSRTPGQTLC